MKTKPTPIHGCSMKPAPMTILGSGGVRVYPRPEGCRCEDGIWCCEPDPVCGDFRDDDNAGECDHCFHPRECHESERAAMDAEAEREREDMGYSPFASDDDEHRYFDNIERGRAARAGM